ncbi:MAG: amidohydrolase family protein [Dorea sp.]|nr:amidohydrolase family protein [Dorea sp.]
MSYDFILKGDIAYSRTVSEISTLKDSYLVCKCGICQGVYDEIPKEYQDLPVLDYSGKLLIPGMSDLHVHAPQYTYRGTGMDLELLDWLSTYTFPEEAKFQDFSYAKEAYSYFTDDLRRSYTTRAVIFATVHPEATVELMDQLEASGLVTHVGKVNMDRNSTANLDEGSAEESMKNTRLWLSSIEGRYARTFPILTPRFIPSCSDQLMEDLGKLAHEKCIRIQSHLSENPDEIRWVSELVPASTCYANAYEMFGHMGSPECPTVMAHCVYSDEREMEILGSFGAYIAHCPSSNMNVASGIAPIKRFLARDLHVGLGTDVAGGTSLNMLQTIRLAIQSSKMYYRLIDSSCKPLTFEEGFYLATAGGGAYFGKVGSFEKGYACDVLVLDDSQIRSPRRLSIKERVERACYIDNDVHLIGKFVNGRQII